MDDLPLIFDCIAESTGKSIRLNSARSISGGCINQCFKVECMDSTPLFLKKNAPSFLPFFKAEALALREMEETHTIRVPQVITWGKTELSSFLVLEFIPESGPTASGQEKMGTLLAQMHRTPREHFGWSQDNCIGATPQPNPYSTNGVSFYIDYRLHHQFGLAEKKGRLFEGKNQLINNIDSFFVNYTPVPSLLHGDLWGGNASYTPKGEPFIFDPASYYGDRETDLAFTYMFGGFDSSFYKGYEKTFPLDQGFKARKTLYNLYHELNHFNLFGGGYANSAQSSINQLLKQIP